MIMLKGKKRNLFIVVVEVRENLEVVDDGFMELIEYVIELLVLFVMVSM